MKIYCDIITEERAVARLWHSKQLISVTTAVHATEVYKSHKHFHDGQESVNDDPRCSK